MSRVPCPGCGDLVEYHQVDVEELENQILVHAKCDQCNRYFTREYSLSGVEMETVNLE